MPGNQRRLESIGLAMSPATRFFLIALADLLKRRHGCRIHLYCSTSQEAAYYNGINQGQTFDSIQNSEALYRTKTDLRPEEIVQEARRWERILGCTFNTLAVGDRHFGRGFALAGPGHPRSRLSEEWHYDDMLISFIRACEFWDREIRNRSFDVLLNCTPVAMRVARAHSVPCRTLLGSRYENLHFWAHGEFWDNPALRSAFERQTSEQADKADLVAPYFLERSHRKVYERDMTLLGLFKELGLFTARQLYYRLRGYEKGRNYYLGSSLRYIWLRWSDTRIMSGRHRAKAADIKDLPYVFFPLHTEPEASLGQLSPEFFYQHAAIAALSRDLPAGVLLAVKETIHGVGRRPRDFYRSIADLKNVVWIDMLEQGVDVVRHALAVATITGTAGMEGAVMGKPVIVFGRHNLYGFLPHIFEIRDEAELKHCLAKIVDSRVDLERARHDGSRYLRAVVDTSFDMRDYDYLNLRKFADESVRDAADALEAGLIEPTE